MPKCDFNKVVKQLYLNHTSAWVFSCKFAEHLLQKHLWTTTSVNKMANSETAAHWCFKKNVLAGIHFQRS